MMSAYDLTLRINGELVGRENPEPGPFTLGVRLFSHNGVGQQGLTVFVSLSGSHGEAASVKIENFDSKPTCPSTLATQGAVQISCAGRKAALWPTLCSAGSR